MAGEPEIKIKVSTEASDGDATLDALVAALKEVGANAEASQNALRGTQEQVRALAERAEALRYNAETTNNPFIDAAANNTLMLVTGTIDNLNKAAGQLGNTFERLKNATNTAAQGLQNGSVSAETAAGWIGRLQEAVAAGEREMEKMSSVMGGVQETFSNAAGLERMLTAYGEFSVQMEEVATRAARMQRQLAAQVKSYGEQAAALDKTSAGYTRQNAALQKASSESRKYIAALEGVVAKVESVKAAVDASVDGFDKLGGLSEAMESLNSAGDELIELGAKVTDVQEDAAESSAKLANESEKAAQQVAAAAKKAAAAAEAEARAEQKNANAMRLTKMSKGELIAETQRLLAARKAAAAAGDAERYNALTAQLTQCRTQMRALTQQRTLDRMATVQQAQAGMQLAGGLGNLAEMAKGGAKNIAGMASQVVALGLALKTAMGPLGWVMAGLQLLQSAYNWLSESQERAAESAKRLAEAQAKYQEVMLNTCVDRIRRQVAAVKQGVAEQIAAYDKLAQNPTSGNAAEAQQEELNKRVKMLKAELKQELAEKKAAAEDTTASEIELLKLQQTAEKKIRLAEQKAEEEARRASLAKMKIQQQAMEDAIDLAEKESAAIQAKFKEVYNAWENKDSAGVQAVIDRIDELKAKKESQEEQAAEIKKQLDELGSNSARIADFNSLATELARVQSEIGVTSNLLKEEIGKSVRQYGSLTDAVRRQENMAELGEREALMVALELKKQLELEQEGIKNRQTELFTLTGRMANVQKSNENWKEISEIENKTADLTAQTNLKKAEANAEFAEILKNAKLQGNYSQQNTQTLEEQAQQDKETLRVTLARLRKLKGEKGLDQAMYERLNEAIKDTVEKQKAIGATLRAERAKQLNKAIEDGLKSLLDSTKLSGNYAQNEQRTKAQILQTDKALLARRREELLRMLSEEKLDPKLKGQINKALREVEQQAAGLANELRKNAIEANKWLKELKPPQLQAAHKNLQKSLEGAARQFVYWAGVANEAAKSGDSKKYAAAMRHLKPLEGALKRLSGNSSAAAEFVQETNGHLREVRTYVREQKRGAGRAAKAQQGAASAAEEIAKSGKATSTAGRQASKAQQGAAKAAEAAGESSRKAASSAQESARAAAREASARKKAAENAEKDANASSKEPGAAANKGNEAASAIADVSRAVSALQGAMRNLAGKHSELAGHLVTLGANMTTLVNVTTQMATAAQGGAQAAASGIDGLRTQLEALRKAVDLLNRKS